MADGITLSDFGSPLSAATLVTVLVWVIRTWPYWKQRINEARKIQLDADGERLAQAFARIRELEETQSSDRREFHEALSDERKRCDRELDEIRARLTASEQREQGLLGMIRQNSQSSAQMIGRPGDVAESRARRGGDDD